MLVLPLASTESSMSPRMLTVVDLNHPTPVPAWTLDTQWVERVETIDTPVATLGAPNAALPWPAIETLEALRTHTAGAFDGIVVVSPDQLFLDPAVVRNTLRRWNPAHTGYFTQLEHCRLPVGIGVWGTAVANLVAADSLTEVREQILQAPGGHRFHYDPIAHVRHADSLLDSRTGVVAERIATTRPPSFDLQGFLAWADGQHDHLRYHPHRSAPRVDHRHMPAAYGFETTDCADFPTYVMFDITNLCNAKCVHCPQSIVGPDGEKPEYLRNVGHIALDDFKRVIDECVGRPLQFVRITADGEPLVHKHLFEMLEYARDRGVGPVGLTTNGSLLSEKRARRLAQSGVQIVDFSLDAASADTFAQIRVGLKYDQTIRNVLRFIQIRDELGLDISVMVSFVKQEGNVGELDAFRAFWEPKVDKVLVREMTENTGLNDSTESAWPGWDHRWPCPHFFRRVTVNHNGVVKACPIDWRQALTHRPVADETVAGQWHSDWYWAYRMHHLNDAIPESSICHDCRDWSQTPWSLGYEKVVSQLRKGA
jgi:hypothetical protein